MKNEMLSSAPATGVENVCPNASFAAPQPETLAPPALLIVSADADVAIAKEVAQATPLNRPNLMGFLPKSKIAATPFCVISIERGQ
ncbi:MAG: hypothetical protein ACJA1L_002749 [Paracoccaceae bacterium]|jgi:hypothetical protein